MIRFCFIISIFILCASCDKINSDSVEEDRSIKNKTKPESSKDQQNPFNKLCFEKSTTDEAGKFNILEIQTLQLHLDVVNLEERMHQLKKTQDEILKSISHVGYAFERICLDSEKSSWNLEKRMDGITEKLVIHEKYLKDIHADLNSGLEPHYQVVNKTLNSFDQSIHKLDSMQEQLTEVCQRLDDYNSEVKSEKELVSSCNKEKNENIYSSLTTLEENHEDMLRIIKNISRTSTHIDYLLGTTQDTSCSNQTTPKKVTNPSVDFISVTTRAKKPDWCKNSEVSKYCDDHGNVIIQLHENSKESFNRTWTTYKWGFGDIKQGNYWIGNEALHYLTTKKKVVLRFDLEDFNKDMRWAEYDIFEVGPEHSGYVLKIDEYKGNAGDSMIKTHNGQKFSTYDHNNIHCANQFGGGWWFEGCHSAFLNGVYDKTGESSNYYGIVWSEWRGGHNLAKSKISARIIV